MANGTGIQIEEEQFKKLSINDQNLVIFRVLQHFINIQKKQTIIMRAISGTLAGTIIVLSWLFSKIGIKFGN